MVAPTHPPTAATRDAKLAKLRESAEQIEALMLKDIVARLRQDTFAQKPSDPMAGLAADMMNDAVATALSRRGGIGIGRMLAEALTPAVGAVPAGTEAVVKGPEEGA
jgi:Rod binding domain-containing protein